MSTGSADATCVVQSTSGSGASALPPPVSDGPAFDAADAIANGR
jgi:hypothetical protein